MDLPAIIYGGAALSTVYNDEDHLASDTPLRSVRLALRYILECSSYIFADCCLQRYGIRAFDTSPYYGSSETVLGNILHVLRDEFPRSSYQLVCVLDYARFFGTHFLFQITKCGRFGPSTFDYSPPKIRQAVLRSLDQLKTDYLDAVYLHDVEFVCTPVAPKTTGNHATALRQDAVSYGLGKGDEGTVRGEGDRQVLDAFQELQQLQRQGLVKKIGITGEVVNLKLSSTVYVISGYPLPTLLRLAILILHTPPGKPVDVVLSYSHLCLQNSTLMEFVPHFYDRAKVGQLISASPLSMGLLTSKPPSWHPAPRELRQAVIDASRTWPGDFPNLAIGYSMSQSRLGEKLLPLVVGLSTPREVHEAVAVWRESEAGQSGEERRRGEECVREVIKNAGYLNWSWASPNIQTLTK